MVAVRLPLLSGHIVVSETETRFAPGGSVTQGRAVLSGSGGEYMQGSGRGRVYVLLRPVVPAHGGAFGAGQTGAEGAHRPGARPVGASGRRVGA